MSLRKYQSVEVAEIVSPRGHKVIQSELHKVGKTSMQDATPAQREEISRKLDSDDKS